ncbi:MAG: hypothetical protein R6X17_10890 [Candidatus Competibacteraceae bacterium]|jgi:hypothetical protein
MTDQSDEQQRETTDLPGMEERREFLRGLGKWSQAVIGGVLLGGSLTVSRPADASSWINRRGDYWGGGGSWVNRSGGWNNRGGSWSNRGGGWSNRSGGGGWVNRRGGWYNGGWNNRGGSWINRNW